MPEQIQPISERPMKEILRLWQGRVELARRYQMQNGNQDTTRSGSRWDQNVKALAGDFNTAQELSNQEAIDVNIIRSNVKVKVAPLTINHPFVTVTATKGILKDGRDNIRLAEKTELELNYWAKELEVRQVVRKAAIDGEATNHGYAYLGKTQAGDGYDSKISDRRENHPTIKSGQPFVRRLSPKQVLVPPGYTDLEDCPWVDIVWIKPLRHVQQKFGERADDVQATEYVTVDGDDKNQRFNEFLESDDVKMVKLHNVWDKETKKVYVFAQDYTEDFLEDPIDWPWDLEGFPLVHYRPEDIPDEYYGTPPISYTLPQQKELNAARTFTKGRFSRTKSSVFVTDSVPDKVMDDYKKGLDGQMYKIGNIEGPIGQHMQFDNGLPLDQHGLAYGQVIMSDIMQIDGISAEQRGSGDPNSDSATSSANIEKNVQIRGGERSDKIRTFYLQIFKKLWMLLKIFPDTKRTRRIVGAVADQAKDVPITRKDLHGEFDFDMDISAMVADTPQNRIVGAIQNYNLLGPDPMINREQLVFDIINTQNKRNPEAYLLQLRDPKEEFETMLMRQVPVEPHERDNHEQHIEMHDVQSAQVGEMIKQHVPGSAEQGVPQTAQILLLAHIKAHQDILERLAGAQGRQPGQPIDQNILNNQNQRANGETEAELRGNPVIQ